MLQVMALTSSALMEIRRGLWIQAGHECVSGLSEIPEAPQI